MEVFLVSHGESRPENEDPTKSLLDRGRSDVSLVASHLSSIGLKPSKIYHSDKLRSKQTAEILYDKIKPKHGIEEVKGPRKGICVSVLRPVPRSGWPRGGVSWPGPPG